MSILGSPTGVQAFAARLTIPACKIAPPDHNKGPHNSNQTTWKSIALESIDVISSGVVACLYTAFTEPMEASSLKSMKAASVESSVTDSVESSDTDSVESSDTDSVESSVTAHLEPMKPLAPARQTPFRQSETARKWQSNMNQLDTDQKYALELQAQKEIDTIQQVIMKKNPSVAQIRAQFESKHESTSLNPNL